MQRAVIAGIIGLVVGLLIGALAGAPYTYMKVRDGIAVIKANRYTGNVQYCWHRPQEGVTCDERMTSR